MKIDNFFKTNDLIYHYAKYTTAIEKILFDKQLKLSSLRDTNDPREYKFLHFNSIGWNLSESASVDLNKATSVINCTIENSYKIACFCTNSLSSDNEVWSNNFFDYGFARSRMWSQYCDNYGVCIAFSKSKLIKHLNSKYNNKVYYGNVDYVKDPTLSLSFRNLDANKLVESDIKQYAFNHVKKFHKDLFFKKQNDYRDENEFRIVIYNPEVRNIFIDVSKFVDAIILGDRFPKAYKEIILKYGSDLNVPVRKIMWSHGEPYLLEWRS